MLGAIMAIDPRVEAEKVRALLKRAGAEITARAGIDEVVVTDEVITDAGERLPTEVASAMLEAALLVATADGVLTDPESEYLVELAGALQGVVVRDRLTRQFALLANLLDRDGFTARIARVGERLRESSAARAAFMMALSMFMLSDDEDPVGDAVEAPPGPEAVLVCLARALDISHDESKSLAAEWLCEVRGLPLAEAHASVESSDLHDPGMSDEESAEFVANLGPSR